MAATTGLGVPAAEPVQILVFLVEGRRYGLPVADVAQVVRSVAVTALPGAPQVIEGVVDVRGTLVPVYDLRRRLGFPARGNEPSDRLVLARCGGMLVGMRVDDVAELVNVAADEIVAAGNADRVAGIARTPDGLVLLYNLPAFLSRAESEELEQALSAAASEIGRAA